MIKDKMTDTAPETKLSIGEEFIDWAKRSWRLHELKPKEGEFNAETSTPDAMMNAFIWKINSLIKERIGPL